MKNALIAIVLVTVLGVGYLLQASFLNKTNDVTGQQDQGDGFQINQENKSVGAKEKFTYTDYMGNEYDFLVVQRDILPSAPEGLTRIDHSFYKDDNYIYWWYINDPGESAILLQTDFDVNTFRVLGAHAKYARDKNGVYLVHSRHTDFPTLSKVPGADPLTFTSFELSDYYEVFLDKNQVYLREYDSNADDLEKLVNLSDLTGAQEGRSGLGYFGDSNNTILLIGAGLNGFFAEALEGVDAHSFEVLGECRPSDGFLHSTYYYFKDKNDVYDSEGTPLNVDLNSLKIYDDGYLIYHIKDKDAVYEKCGALMKGVDSDTFEFTPPPQRG